MEIDNSNLALLFTRGISFSMWKKSGLLEREVKIYQELSKKFKSIYFFTYGVHEEDKYSELFSSNVHIICRPNYIPKTLYSFLIPFIHRKIWKKISIVKTNQMDGSYVAVFVKKMYGIKMFLRMGYEWLEYLRKEKRPLIKRLIGWLTEYFAYKNADVISISSEGGKKFILENFKVASEKITIIPNYVDTNKFSPNYTGKDLNRLIFVGRLEPVKNLINLVDAISKTDIKLVLVGEGSQKDSLAKTAKEKNSNVEFLGIVSQNKLPEELNKSSAFILPSFSEGNPKALLEAMSCGLACIGSSVPGISSIIKDGENGLLCGTDVESIKQSLDTLMKNDDLKIRLGLSAREAIVKNFSFENILEKEVNIYNSI